MSVCGPRRGPAVGSRRSAKLFDGHRFGSPSVMSLSAEDFRSAAGRHLADAVGHLAAGNFAQATHLAGFGPECARKAALPARWHKRLGHAMSGAVLDTLAALDTHGVCMGPLPALGAWTPELRYRASRYFTKLETDALVHAAEVATRAALARAWIVGEPR